MLFAVKNDSFSLIFHDSRPGYYRNQTASFVRRLTMSVGHSAYFIPPSSVYRTLHGPEEYFPSLPPSGLPAVFLPSPVLPCPINPSKSSRKACDNVVFVSCNSQVSGVDRVRVTSCSGERKISHLLVGV